VPVQGSPAAATELDVSLLTPIGALLALGAALPLLALVLQQRRGDTIRRAVGLTEPSSFVRRLPLVAVGAVAVLLGFAAAQPRIEWTSTREARTDAEAFVVLDTSRSMLARSGPRAQFRFERAQAAALRIREGLLDVPVGIASLTDRVLPHLFPSIDDDVFVATLQRSIAVDRPPPRGSFSSTATQLEALEAVLTRRFFTRTASSRLLVVLTDGESVPVAGAKLGAAFRRPPGVATVFVHFWDQDERVYDAGEVEPQYSPDPQARAILDGTASAIGGHVFAEEDLDAAIAKARELLGSGELEPRGERRHRLALAPYLSAAAFLPLLVLLWRRDR
jgi:hypothetical protein